MEIQVFKPTLAFIDVLVATYTNEGLKFQMVLGPLKFEPRPKGRPRIPATAL